MPDIDPAEPSSAAGQTAWGQARRAGWTASATGPPTALLVRALLVTAVVLIAAGVLGAWLWTQLADPPTFRVVKANAVMGEEQAGRQFGVDLSYALIGLGLSAPLGFLAGWRWHRVGWPLVVAAAVGAGLGAVVAWRVGIAWGPADPATLWRGAQVGDRLPEQLDVHAEGLLLSWPVGALVGVLLAVLVFWRPSRSRPFGAYRADPEQWRGPPEGADDTAGLRLSEEQP